jgi:hypothetical protein
MGFPLPVGVVNTSSAYFYASGSGGENIGALIVQPSEATLVFIDYSKLTPPSNTFTQHSFTVDAASNPPLVVTYDQPNQQTTVLSFLLSGGVPGQQYNIAISVTGAVGRTDILRVNIPSISCCDSPTINSWGAGNLSFPGFVSSLPFQMPFVNGAVRYFWGPNPPNAPNLLDQWFNTMQSQLYEWVTDGSTYFWNLIASDNWVTDAPANGHNYVRVNNGWTLDPIQVDVSVNSPQLYSRTYGAWVLDPIQTDAPFGGTIYGRENGAWVLVPYIIPDAPGTSQRFGRYNSTWQLDAIQTDAPNDGNAYVRQSGDWSPAVIGGPYLPIAGGTITGSLTVNQVLTVQGSNSLVLNAPVTGGNQRSILGMASNVSRWVLTLGDQTAEGLNNTGSNFNLAAYSTTGAFLGNWLSIARADGSTMFNGSGVTIAGGLAVNGLLSLADLTHLAIYGGTAGQVLTTNGSGILSWTTGGGSGGIADAPNDGTLYARKSAAWAHPVHTDITDWTATLAPYALITNTVDSFNARTGAVTLSSNDVTGALGFTPVASFNTRTGVITLTSSDVTSALGFTPYNTTNPAGYQTAAQVTASLGAYLLLAGGTLTGALTLSADPTQPLQAATKEYVDTPTNMSLDCGTY